jgi:predicted acetyltransferase
MGESLTFVQADEALLEEYDALAGRSYGHRVEDITLLRRHADTRVALRDGRVVAGGLGFLIPQFFGGQPIPSACLGSGCVAPEERGQFLAVRMLSERIRALQERGAVLATLWTNSNGYARRVGWEAPAQVFTWSVPTEELKRSFERGDLTITHGDTHDTDRLQRGLAQQWNGPLSRPVWWSSWQREKYRLTTYRFSRKGQPPSGFLALAPRRREQHGTELVVQDFWAADESTASSMLSFLGGHNSTITSIKFERTSLPPYPVLQHNLHRNGAVVAHAKPGWMIRILDLREAVRLRGWPADLDATIPIEVGTEDGDSHDRFVLRITSGASELSPSRTASQAAFTRRQFAAWYAGGYRTVTSARLSGVRGTPEALSLLVRATADREPWMPDHF